MRARLRTALANDAGMTLLELMVVLAILALAGGLALRLALGAPTGLSLTAAAEDIATEARRARLLALQSNRETVLLLDAGKRRVWIEGHGEGESLGSDIALALTTAAPERQSATVGGIRFFADGSATGGEVRLSRAGQSRNVTIDWLLGEVRVSDE